MRRTHPEKIERGSTRKTRRNLRVRPRFSASGASFIFRLLSFLLFSSLILPPSSFAAAQTSAYAEISAPDASGFPKIVAVLDVYDANGQFVGGLKPADASALEDGTPRPVQELTEEPVGAQIVVGVNPGPALDVRDAQGVTRYQRVQQALGGWAQSLDAEKGDNLSLVTIAGPLIAHTAPDAWLASFAAFQPDFRATTPNIQSLVLSLETALAATPQVGMKRAILFVTPHMEDAALEAALKTVGERAVQSRTRVNIWLVDGEQYFNHPSVALFQALAAQTGGGFLTFSGRETLPNPETYFSPLRRVYRLTYASALNSSGDHALSVEVTLGGASVASEPREFTLNVQPPNPIFADLPAQLTRAAPPEDPYNTEVLVPNEQALQIVFDFPDGHPRPIVRAALYVDDELAAENVSGALDRFAWDISGYTASGQHMLKVEATDSLGLTGQSLALPVVVTIVKPPGGPLVLLARYRFVIVWGVVGIAGLAFLAVLFGSRLRRARRERRTKRREYADPLTQPVPAALEPPTGRRKTTKRAAPDQVTDAAARLVRLEPDGTPAAAAPIPIDLPELTLGTDPVQASVILDDPALSPLHARIRQTEAGYAIFDQFSVAGTWVNYEPVTQEGHPLKHGDRVNFGHLTYRFEMKNPPTVTEPSLEFS
ncbi:MAG: hypothetical protein PGMFKBFP_00927 [Anaerolineales bacterium]|nr:hypothetical protein [Anaerolineales bacterium]